MLHEMPSIEQIQWPLCQLILILRKDIYLTSSNLARNSSWSAAAWVSKTFIWIKRPPSSAPARKSSEMFILRLIYFGNETNISPKIYNINEINKKNKYKINNKIE